MKKKLLLEIFVFGMILFALVIKTQSITGALCLDNQIKDQLNLALSSTSHKLLDLSLTPHEPIEILNDDNFTDYGFLGLGTAEEPYIIENYDITTTYRRGIYINGTTKHFVIRNCYVELYYMFQDEYDRSCIYISNVAEGTASNINNTVKNHHGVGISLYSSSGATLTNNNGGDIFLWSSSGATLTNNNGGGIYLYSSSDATLMNNTCSNNWYGIFLWSSSGAILTNNTCSNNKVGIELFLSSGATLDNNTCSNNEGRGILLGDSANSTLDNNTCSYNRNGIVLSSDGATLTNNYCSNNEGYGISLLGGLPTVPSTNSENNIIHHNIFINNNLGGTSQAYDVGTNNTWYEEETKEGNYWSDWNKKKPYPIDGNANATDPYPLNENLEIIDYEYTLVIPALILVAILLKRKRNNHFRS